MADEKTATPADPVVKSYLLAGFRSGWAAACLTIADMANDPKVATVLRRMSQQPPPLEIGDLSTPEGKAMKAKSETVWMDTLEKGPARG